jgi:hypothetical protein
VIFINKLLFNLSQNDLIKILIAAAAAIVVFIVARILYKKSKEADYFVKQRLLTQTELEYYEIIRSLISSQFVILPQVNLASVIDKKGGSNFRSELFRNIDFGVFDGDLRPIFLIEINDNTHFRRDRKERDKKVNKICKKAGMPLVTFWVKDGIDVNDMARTLKTAINKGLRSANDRERG